MPDLEIFLKLIEEAYEEERLAQSEQANKYYNPDLEIEDPMEF